MVVGEFTQETNLLVIGGGPGGYVAACAAADAGIHTTLVESADVPGGVCLREGCIPSKTLLHVAKTITDAAHARKFGISFESPRTDVAKLRNWKNGVVRKLAAGVKALLAGREVETIHGRASFDGAGRVRVESDSPVRIKFRHCIIATGSVARQLPESLVPRDLCWDAADALAVHEIPKRLLVIGGGYIGLELGQVYAALGSDVTIIEALPTVLAGVDPDLARPLVTRLRKQFQAIHTGATLEAVERRGDAVQVTYAAGGNDHAEEFDRILVSVGRSPNTENLGLDSTKVELDEAGFIKVNAARQTAEKRVYAIGDVTGNPMLAHKAMREAKVAVDAIAGKPAAFDPACIPAVVYTDPEVAWCGLTEDQANDQGREVKITKFPWTASGRAVSMGRTEGLTKLLFEPKTQRVLGVGIVGAHAGDLISEGVLAIEMAAVAEDIATAIHPHPATSETLAEAAEAMFTKAIHGTH